MIKIENAFQTLKEKNPTWSTFTCLAVSLIGKSYGKMAIGRAFKKCVDSEDYVKKEKESILTFLNSL